MLSGGPELSGPPERVSSGGSTRERRPGVSESRDEDDPTGMRHLLSSMSDPEPMSEDMVRRIAADIERERSQGERDYHRFDPAVAAPPTRRRGAALVLLGGAAAIAFALPVLADALTRPSVPTSAALVPSLAGEPSAQAPAPPAPTVPPSTNSPAPTAVTAGMTLVSTGTDYHRGDLAGQLTALIEREQVPSSSASVITSTGDAPDDTATSVRTCLHALALDHRKVVVDVATYEGRPSLVVVGPPSHGHSGGLRTATVMPRDCSRDDTVPFAGPLRVH